MTVCPNFHPTPYAVTIPRACGMSRGTERESAPPYRNRLSTMSVSSALSGEKL